MGDKPQQVPALDKDPQEIANQPAAAIEKPQQGMETAALEAQENSTSSCQLKAVIAPAADQPIMSALETRRVLEDQLQSLVLPYLPSPQIRRFHLFAIDVTLKRQFSPTLED